MWSAFAGARNNRLDLSVGISLGVRPADRTLRCTGARAAQLCGGPTPHGPAVLAGAVIMILISAFTASLVSNSGRSAWFLGVLLLMVYFAFALALYLLPPKLA